MKKPLNTAHHVSPLTRKRSTASRKPSTKITFAVMNRSTAVYTFPPKINGMKQLKKIAYPNTRTRKSSCGPGSLPNHAAATGTAAFEATYGQIYPESAIR